MAASRNQDPALETLFLPIATARVAWPPDGTLFLRARDGEPLRHQPLPGLICEQSFKPDADALLRAGFAVNPSEERKYALVMMLPPRQRDEARALMARAVTLIRPGGRIIACVANTEGARSSEADFAQLVGPVVTESKHKCRVFWSAPLDGPANAELAQQWLALDTVRPIEDGRFLSRPGIFAWDRIDAASALLAAHLPDDLAGRAADLGAGFGYLAAEMLARCRRITALDIYEAEARALDLARLNLKSHEARVAIGYCWHDVSAGLPSSYDVIVSNPPFHGQGRADRPDLGRQFIVAAAKALRPGGRLWMVANRHLPYENVLHDNFRHVRTVVQQDGHKVIEAMRYSQSR